MLKSRRIPKNTALPACLLAALLSASCASHTGGPARAAGGTGLHATDPQPRAWTFETDAIGAAPEGFTFALTGEGRPGRWEVVAAKDAAEGRYVVAQLDAQDVDDRYPLAIANAPVLADLRLSVQGRPMSGVIDQVVGLVFRYRDPDTYYLARANVLEGNVRLYHVTDGKRKQLASWQGTVPPGQWLNLEVEARGEQLRVRFNGALVIDHTDGTLTEAGRIGLWTKADSVTQFDRLSVLPLEP